MAEASLQDLIDRARDKDTQPKTKKQLTAEFDTLLQILPKRVSDEDEVAIAELFSLWATLKNTKGGDLFGAPGAVSKAKMIDLAARLGIEKSGTWLDIRNRIQDIEKPLSELEDLPEVSDIINLSEEEIAAMAADVSKGVKVDIPSAEKMRTGSFERLMKIQRELRSALTKSDLPEEAKRIEAVTTALLRILINGVDPSKPGESGRSFLSFAMPKGLHLAGYNYCGPGTPVLENLLSGMLPINDLDEACMMHDVAYIRAGAMSSPNLRKKTVEKADKELIEKSRQIAENSEGALQRQAEQVNGAMTIKAKAGLTDAFLTLDAPPIDAETADEIVDKYFVMAKAGSEMAGNPPALEGLLRRGEDPREEVDPEKPTGAEAEEKGEEEEQITETAPVLPPEAEAAIAKEIPKPIVPSRPRVPDDEGRHHLPPAGEKPITGERSMRPMAFRMEGDEVEPDDEERRQNQLWLENFTWIDEGHGLGNQERLPWNFGGGKAKNSLFRAQKINEMIQYSGDLFIGDQSIDRLKATSKPISAATRAKYRQPMIPTSQRSQEFIRNGPLPAGLGRPIQMMRDPQTTPMAFRTARSTNLIHPDVVDGKRL